MVRPPDVLANNGGVTQMMRVSSSIMFDVSCKHKKITERLACAFGINHCLKCYSYREVILVLLEEASCRVFDLLVCMSIVR